MFDDYILYHLEHMCCSEVSDEILAEIRGTPKVSSISKDIILPSNKMNSIDIDRTLAPVMNPDNSTKDNSSTGIIQLSV